MTRSEEYRRRLRDLDRWEPYLLEESRLPGPRANLELLHAVAEEGTSRRFLAFLERTPDRAPTGTPEEFLPACGATGLGAAIARGEAGLWPRLREAASDPRWRVREGVAMGLQRIGDRDMDALLRELRGWTGGTPLERRAVAAGLCEPRLLVDARHAREVLEILDGLTRSLAAEQDRRDPDVRVLRKTLGYAWSVAIVASPAEGRARFERWAEHDDPDVRWVVRENLRKKRLRTMDRAWVDGMLRRIARE